MLIVLIRNKSQKRVHAPNRDLPPRNEQFLLDFELLQSQFNVKSRFLTIFIFLFVIS